MLIPEADDNPLIVIPDSKRIEPSVHNGWEIHL
jgi:hypothetical protein